MKLVLLEALIVLVAMRAILSLLGHAPPWPTPVWEGFAVIGLLATAGICIQAVRDRFKPPAPIVPPHIPLERIGPFEPDAMLVRFGARGGRNINLN